MCSSVSSKFQLRHQLAVLCCPQAPNDVLAEWVVLRAKVQPNQAAPFFLEGNQVGVRAPRRGGAAHQQRVGCVWMGWEWVEYSPSEFSLQGGRVQQWVMCG